MAGSKSLRGCVFALTLCYYVFFFSEMFTVEHLTALQQVYKWLGIYVLIGSVITRHLKKGSRYLIMPSSFRSAVELVVIIIVTKMFARGFIILLNLNLVVLFKATTFTASLASGIISRPPLLLLALIPVLQRVSWYYIIAYCALCGGSVLGSIFGLTVVVSLAWRHLVISPWTDAYF
jgi:hypothetical protein